MTELSGAAASAGNGSGDAVPELAILIGLQASGKSTFCRQVLATSHVVVSKDDFRNARHRQRRQLRLIGEALATGRSVVVDNTNPSLEQWRPLIDVGHAYRAVVCGYWFPPDLASSLVRNAARDERIRVPDVGLYATVKQLRRPELADGFDRLRVVCFDGTGGFTVGPLPERTQHGR